MPEESKKDSDFEELFSHIKKIIAERKKTIDKSDETEIDKSSEEKTEETTKMIQEPTDVEKQDEKPSEQTENVVTVEIEDVSIQVAEEPQQGTFDKGEISTETSEMTDIFTTIMEPTLEGWTDDSVSTCDLCKREIALGKNLTGLVVDDSFFACEDCCRSVAKDELMNWTKSRMIKSNAVRPIGRWLTQEKTKGRSILFKE